MKHQKIGHWLFIDSGVRSGAQHMAIDRGALESMTAGVNRTPILRFFQWEAPVVTYGYLLDPARVRAFATEHGKLPMVQRPTGGGAVAHAVTDLSLSLLWSRHQAGMPSKPRDCYAAIHAALKEGVRSYLGEGLPALYAPDSACAAPSTDAPAERFSVCFEEPVCDDVMLGERKIIGGALRLTRTAILYQGAVQLRRIVNLPKLKSSLLSALRERLLAPGAPAEPDPVSLLESR